MLPEEANDAINRQVRFYLILGTAFLAAAGLLCSLDSSFLWINFAIGAFCYAMAYTRLPKAAPPEQNLKQTSRQATRPVFTTPQNPANSRRIIIFASAFIVGIFFLITFLAIVFSSDSTDDYYSYWGQAENFRMNGDYDSAMVYYRRAMNVAPDDAEPLMGYGRSMMGKGDYDSAYYYFDRVLEMAPLNAEASYNKSLVRFNQNSFDDAIEDGRKTLSIDPMFHSAEVVIGDSFYSKTNYDSAMYYYTMAYDNDIRSPWVCHVLGYLHQTKGNTNEAIALYKEAISYDSTMTEVYQRLGELIPGAEGDYYRQRAAQRE